MAFSTYNDLYKFFSSDILLQTILSLNKKVLESFRKVHKMKFSTSTLAKRYETLSEPGLVIQFFYESDLYYESSEYDDEDKTDDKMAIYAKQAELLFYYAIWILKHPTVPEYLRFCKKVNTIIGAALLKEFDDAGIKGLITDIDAALQEYATDMSDYYDENLWELEGYDELSSFLQTRSLESGSKKALSYLDQTPLDDDVAEEIQKLYDFACDPRIPDEVIKYMLNPTVGTAGLALNSPTQCPIYATIFPVSWLLQHADELWNDRAAKMKPKPLLPSKYSDNYQSNCESKFYHKFTNATMKLAMDEKMKQYRNKEEGDDDDDAAPGMSTSTSGPSATGTGKGSGKGTPPVANSSGTNPAIPDDSTYNPDLMLAQKAKEYTEAYRADAKYAAHDFMTRFKTNSEMYVGHSIPDYEMRRSNPDADWFISTMMSGKSTFYVVTFSRKSKKPIFSVVI